MQMPFHIKSRGPILCVTSSETRSICVKQATEKFEYLSLIGQCRSLFWSRDRLFIKLRLYLLCTHFWVLKICSKTHSICRDDGRTEKFVGHRLVYWPSFVQNGGHANPLPSFIFFQGFLLPRCSSFCTIVKLKKNVQKL